MSNTEALQHLTAAEASIKAARAELGSTAPAPGPGPSPIPTPTPIPIPVPTPVPVPGGALVINDTNQIAIFAFPAGDRRFECSGTIDDIRLDDGVPTNMHCLCSLFATRGGSIETGLVADYPRMVFGLYLNNTKALFLATGVGTKGPSVKLGQIILDGGVAVLKGARFSVVYENGTVTATVGSIFSATGPVHANTRSMKDDQGRLIGGMAAKPLWGTVSHFPSANDSAWDLLALSNFRFVG